MKKRTLFLSYAHHDRGLVNNLAQDLRHHLGCCTKWEFELWQDSGIVCGTFWDQEIRKALQRSAVGLLMVSPAFRCSRYITSVELPELLKKRCLAVGTRPVCFDTQLDPALQGMQFHRLDTPRRGAISYSECRTRQEREQFVNALYQQVLARL